MDQQNKFIKKTELADNDKRRLKQDIEIHLRIERLIDQICRDVPEPTQIQARKYMIKILSNLPLQSRFVSHTL